MLHPLSLCASGQSTCLCLRNHDSDGDSCLKPLPWPKGCKALSSWPKSPATFGAQILSGVDFSLFTWLIMSIFINHLS